MGTARGMSQDRAPSRKVRIGTVAALAFVLFVASCAGSDWLTTGRRTVGTVAVLNVQAARSLAGYELNAERRITDAALAGGSIAEARAKLQATRTRTKRAAEALAALDEVLRQAGDLLATKPTRPQLDDVTSRLLAAQARLLEEFSAIGVALSPPPPPPPATPPPPTPGNDKAPPLMSSTPPKGNP